MSFNYDAHVFLSRVLPPNPASERLSYCMTMVRRIHYREAIDQFVLAPQGRWDHAVFSEATRSYWRPSITGHGHALVYYKAQRSLPWRFVSHGVRWLRCLYSAGQRQLYDYVRTRWAS